MKYILLSDLKETFAVDDSFVAVRARDTKGQIPENALENFTEIDVREILKKAPAQANAIVFYKEDWKYWDMKNNKLLGDVFKK